MYIDLLHFTSHGMPFSEYIWTLVVCTFLNAAGQNRVQYLSNVSTRIGSCHIFTLQLFLFAQTRNEYLSLTPATYRLTNKQLAYAITVKQSLGTHAVTYKHSVNNLYSLSVSERNGKV